MQEKQKALHIAGCMLSQRNRSEKEIVDRLIQKGISESVIAEVMADLSKNSLLCDASFAEEWAKSRMRRGMGPRRIAYELRNKGIDGLDAETALDTLPEDDLLESAIALAKKKLQSDADPRAKKRAYDALLRRGFSYEMAKTAIDQAISDEE